MTKPVIEPAHLERAKTAFQQALNAQTSIAVMGLCAEGGTLLEALNQHFTVLGYDDNSEHVRSLTESFKASQLKSAVITSDAKVLADAQIYILMSCFDGRKERKRIKAYIKALAQVLEAGNCVIFGPEISPELLDDFCLPLLEELSQLKLNEEFFVGCQPAVELDQRDLEKLSEAVKFSNNSLFSEIYAVFRKLKLPVDFAPLVINTRECSEEELQVKDAIRKEWLQILEGMSPPLFRRFMMACIKTGLLDNYSNLLYPGEQKVNYQRFYQFAREIGLSHTFDFKNIEDSLTPSEIEEGESYQGCTARGENVQPPFSEEVGLVYRE